MFRWDRVIDQNDRVYALFTYQHGHEYQPVDGFANVLGDEIDETGKGKQRFHTPPRMKTPARPERAPV